MKENLYAEYFRNEGLNACAGATYKEIMKHYPDLNKEDIDACIEYSRKERKHSKESGKKLPSSAGE